MYRFLACEIGCGNEGSCKFAKEDITPDQDEYPNGYFLIIISSQKLLPQLFELPQLNLKFKNDKKII